MRLPCQRYSSPDLTAGCWTGPAKLTGFDQRCSDAASASWIVSSSSEAAAGASAETRQAMTWSHSQRHVRPASAAFLSSRSSLQSKKPLSCHQRPQPHLRSTTPSCLQRRSFSQSTAELVTTGLISGGGTLPRPSSCSMLSCYSRHLRCSYSCRWRNQLGA